MPYSDDDQTAPLYTLSTLEHTHTPSLARIVREKSPLFSTAGAEKNAQQKIKDIFSETAKEVVFQRRIKSFALFFTAFPSAASVLYTANRAATPLGTLLWGALGLGLLAVGMRAAIRLDKIKASPTTEKALYAVDDKDIFFKAQDKIYRLKNQTLSHQAPSI